MSEIFDWLGKSGGVPRWLEIPTVIATAAAATFAALDPAGRPLVGTVRGGDPA
jgi:hypothetical protein